MFTGFSALFGCYRGCDGALLEVRGQWKMTNGECQMTKEIRKPKSERNPNSEFQELLPSPLSGLICLGLPWVALILDQP
jgi:hypothetical protein